MTEPKIPPGMIWMVCDGCGEPFLRSKTQAAARKSKKVFCTRECFQDNKDRLYPNRKPSWAMRQLAFIQEEHGAWRLTEILREQYGFHFTTDDRSKVAAAIAQTLAEWRENNGRGSAQ